MNPGQSSSRTAPTFRSSPGPDTGDSFGTSLCRLGPGAVDSTGPSGSGGIVPYRPSLERGAELQANLARVGIGQARHPGVSGLPARILHLLVVDEDNSVRQACCEVASQMGFTVFVAENAQGAKTALQHQRIDLMLLDLRHPGSSGLTLLEEVKALHPETRIVVMTAFATVSAAVEAMRLGAANYLTKPFSLDELAGALEAAASNLAIDLASRQLREKLRIQKGMGPLIGSSPGMEKLYRIISKVAYGSHPVLILGEDGTGKEGVARSIHFNGAQAAKPFLPMDCGSLTPAAIEMELFGHAKGAVAGSTRAKDGLLVAADGGTVYLDEVSELPLAVQAKLMRALQDRVVHPIDASDPVPISVRLIAASKRDLKALMEQGRFRKDLYFRLNVVNLKIPALRERREDIPELLRAGLDRMGRHLGATFTFSDEALRCLNEYNWPGNTDELESAVVSACNSASGEIVHIRDLPSALREFHRQLCQSAAAGRHSQEPASLLPAGEGRGERAGAPAGRGHAAGITSIATLEKQAILDTIRQLRGDKLMAARLLGIGKTTLYRKLKEYGISEDIEVGH